MPIQTAAGKALFDELYASDHPWRPGDEPALIEKIEAIEKEAAADCEEQLQARDQDFWALQERQR